MNVHGGAVQLAQAHRYTDLPPVPAPTRLSHEHIPAPVAGSEVSVWIELHDSARDHPKMMKLARQLGIQKVHAFGHMCSLWTWALRMAPDGDLSSFDADDIEIGAEWDGETGAFIKAATKHRLLLFVDGRYSIHDWTDYASHLKAAERKRRERARKAAVSGGHVTSRDVTGHARISGPVTQTDRPTDRQTDRQTPSSTQCSMWPGSESDADDEYANSGCGEEDEQTKAQLTASINSVIEHYRTHHGKSRPGDKERRRIRLRLGEGYSVEDLCKAIDGCHKTPFNLGENERGQKFLSLDLIMRDSDHVARFIEHDDDPPKSERKHTVDDWEPEYMRRKFYDEDDNDK